MESAFVASISAINEGENAVFSGFGPFKLSSLAARQGRNPATGETMEIPASRKLTFAAAKAVRDALNEDKFANTRVANASVNA